MKKNFSMLTAICATVIITACGDYKKDNTTNAPSASSQAQDVSSYDPKRGEGKWTAENINISSGLDAAKAAEGEKIAGTKCLSCHKTSSEKLVGPGWQGVTTRRAPAWIMNFITNPDPMLDKDPEAQSMLEICLVRMPNQNLSDDEARSILEFMRKNDGAK